MQKSSKSNQKNNNQYNPNLGFIGNTEVRVANYLFSTHKNKKAYKHAKPVVKRILDKEVSSHYQESKRLTKFLKSRDLTFSKKTSAGYKTFVVPCTTTVVPLQKSLFNEIELAAQKLMISLRCVLQDIYGAKSVKHSKFAKSLPKDVRKIFIESIENCPTYLPQLHNKNMKKYPFLDNVGLDLVLVEDYIQKSKNFPKLIKNKKVQDIPELPFRILEINAGSPSGASNNMNMLEGIYNQNPEILDGLGKLMPNDHFEILGQTYKSLGESWTGIKDGVQIILPPGGQNGAAPEIHQLAAFSGLIYADPSQLYQDEDGYIRLRTVEQNPIVTAIYSRVNTDSALFDPKKELFLRDQDTGEPIYLRDNLKLGEDGKAPLVKDAHGKNIPLQSAYSIPGAIEAITSGKLYMGGLNRIMDNKIILATLTHYAPLFYADKIKSLGLDLNGPSVQPPKTLPPNLASAKEIAQNPDEWVVKAPSLAGGQGVFILKTLNKNKKEEIINKILEKPAEYAYQQLVKIARIPVAVQRKKDGYKFANLAADIRMWVFFGGEGTLPKVSHNALVRYAPQEKGAMSSIVNTSAGGGYAPFVIMDDIGDKESVDACELVSPKEPIPHKTPIPVFVSAQFVQISRMLKESYKVLQRDDVYAHELQYLMLGLKNQLKEVLSFLHPRGIESIYKILDLLETKIHKPSMARYYRKINNNQLEIVDSLRFLEKKLNSKFMNLIDSLHIIDLDIINGHYAKSMYKSDKKTYKEIKALSKKLSLTQSQKYHLITLLSAIKQSIELEKPTQALTKISKNKIIKNLNNFCASSKHRLNQSESTADFSKLFDADSDVTKLRFETLYLGYRDEDKQIKTATQFEYRTGKKLTDSDYIPAHIQQARQAWLEIEKEAKKLSSSEKEVFLRKKRSSHFRKFPFLRAYQEKLHYTNLDPEDLVSLLPILPYAKFNLEKFAADQGVSIQDVFKKKLTANKISLLTSRQISLAKLKGREYAGECFAKKKRSHGLYSDSDIFLWLRSDLPAFITLYTAGHEIIHYRQIESSMSAEKRALEDGGVSIAKFINYYSNFLGANQRSVDAINFNMLPERTALYGYSDRCVIDFMSPLITEIRQSLSSEQGWDEKLKEFGSLFGYMMPNSPGTRVKALQEVLPALENAKNIRFAKELGLDIDLCEYRSCMPIATNKQVDFNRAIINKLIKSVKPDWEALRVIANNQYYGISFPRAKKDYENISLRPMPNEIAVGSAYNQTQQ